MITWTPIIICMIICAIPVYYFSRAIFRKTNGQYDQESDRVDTIAYSIMSFIALAALGFGLVCGVVTYHDQTTYISGHDVTITRGSGHVMIESRDKNEIIDGADNFRAAQTATGAWRVDSLNAYGGAQETHFTLIDPHSQAIK